MEVTEIVINRQYRLDRGVLLSVKCRKFKQKNL